MTITMTCATAQCDRRGLGLCQPSCQIDRLSIYSLHGARAREGDTVIGMRFLRYTGVAILGASAVLSAAAQNTARDLRTSMATPTVRSRPTPITISDKSVRAGKLSNIDRTKTRTDNAKRLQDELKKRSSGTTRLQGMAVYQPRDGGTPLLTNRITKYDSMKTDYQRIRIKFDPIIKPDRWGATFGKHTDTDIHKYVDYYAQKYNVDSSLIHAIIKVESAGNAYAVSPKGAAGLMQLMPGTAADLNVKNIFDPAENIGGGVQYISKMLGMFKNNYEFALAGYNAGPGAVMKYGGIPPYRETENYVWYVKYWWQYYKANGNSFPYAKFDPSLTKPAIEKKRKEHFITRAMGDSSREMHDVKLASGAVQNAEEVRHQGDYLYLALGGRTVRLNKNMVVEIDGVALEQETPVPRVEILSIPDATVPLMAKNEGDIAT